MVRTKYTPNTNFYNEYYSQNGNGLYPSFQGSIIQKGYGLGGLIAGLARSVIPILTKNIGRGVKYAMPLVKKGAKDLVKKGAKDLGRHVISSGAQSIVDVLNDKTTAKSALAHQKKQMKRKLAEVISASTLSQPPKRRRKTKKRKNTNNIKKDIFT